MVQEYMLTEDYIGEGVGLLKCHHTVIGCVLRPEVTIICITLLFSVINPLALSFS
jgi:hypothetical protein